MEYIEAFRILNIDVTKDEKDIKIAYRQLLPYVNPEDDEEGFMKLREAYEVALEYTKRIEDKESESDNIDRWIEQISNLYYSLKGKSDQAAWGKICEDALESKIGSFDELRERMLVFLMNHVYITQAVWGVIDSKFKVLEDEYLLKEKFDAAYIDYISRRVKEKEYLPLEYIEYRENVSEKVAGNEIDEYIISVYMLDRQINEGKFEQVQAELDRWEKVLFVHPYENVIRIRYYVNILKNKELETNERNNISSKLENALLCVNGYCEEYVRIKPYIGEAYYALNNKDKAFEIWEEASRDAKPDNFKEAEVISLYDLAQYYYDKADYKEAYTKIEPLLEQYYDHFEVKALLDKIDNALIEEFKYKIDNSIEDEKFKGKLLNIELAWKYFQINDLKKGIEVLENISVDDDIEYEYYSLYSRMLFANEEYERALPHLEHWYRLLFALTPCDEESRKKIRRKSLCCSYLSYSSFRNDNNKDALFYIEKAIKTESDDEARKGYIEQKIRLLLDIEQYDDARNACDELTSIDECYYPAYVLHQYACYKLNMAQEVVDDFYRLEGIFDDYYKKFYYAADILCKLGYCEEGLSIIERARENGCMEELDICITELVLKRKNAKDNESKRELLPMIDELQRRIENMDNAPDNASEVLYAKVCILFELNEFDEAIENAQKGIDLYPEKAGYHIVLGDILSDDDYVKVNGKVRIEEALEHYQKALEMIKGVNLWLLFSIGYCYKQVGKIDEEIKYYEEVVQYNPDFENTAYRLINEYLSLYSKKNRKDYIDRALELARGNVERIGDYKALYKLALVYHYMGEVDEAIHYFKEALKYNSESVEALFRIGKNYRRKQDNLKSIEYYLKAIACDKEEAHGYIFEDLGYAYEAMGEYEKAIQSYSMAMEKEKGFEDNYQNIGRCYCKLEKYDLAIENYKREPKHMIAVDLANTYYYVGDMDNSKKYCEEAIKQAENSEYDYRYVYIGDLFLEIYKDYDTAISCFDMGLKLESSYDMKLSVLTNKIKCLMLMNNRQEARNIAEKMQKIICDEIQITVEEYCSNSFYGAINKYKIGWMYIGLGEFREAEKVFIAMDKGPMCVHCKTDGCFESSLYLSILYLLEGRMEEAKMHIVEAKRRVVKDPLVDQIYDMIYG